MTDVSEGEPLDAAGEMAAQVAALEAALLGTSAVAEALAGDMLAMRDSMVFAGREVTVLSTGIGRGLRSAFDGLIFDGLKLSDALKTVGQSIVDNVYNVAMRPVQTAVGGAIAQGINGLLSGFLPFAHGAAFSQGRVTPFARGGVVSSPTLFPMRGGRGLVGEAGPEAILPLARGADGRLGVMAGQGGKAINLSINISTPDVKGFERSQSQLAAAMARALARGERNR